MYWQAGAFSFTYHLLLNGVDKMSVNWKSRNKALGDLFKTMVRKYAPVCEICCHSIGVKESFAIHFLDFNPDIEGSYERICVLCEDCNSQASIS